MFLKAILLGFSVAAPVGPIGILCMRRSIDEGPRIGFATGLGAATADAIYGLVAGLGLTALAAVLTSAGTPLRIGGALFLLVLAYRSWRTRPRLQRVDGARAPSAWKAGATTLLLTLSSPVTLLSFAAMFSALVSPSEGGGLQRALTLAGGVFLGSAVWWLGLSVGSARVGRMLSAVAHRRIDQLSAVMLAGFAIVALLAG